jgi:hypothetical protein
MTAGKIPRSLSNPSHIGVIYLTLVPASSNGK